MSTLARETFPNRLGNHQFYWRITIPHNSDLRQANLNVTFYLCIMISNTAAYWRWLKSSQRELPIQSQQWYNFML